MVARAVLRGKNIYYCELLKKWCYTKTKKPVAKQPETYTQPEYAGGKMVLAKDVPDSYYSIYSEEQDPNQANEFTVLEHENNPCMTKAEIKKQFNCFEKKSQANSALAAIKKAYRG